MSLLTLNNDCTIEHHSKLNHKNYKNHLYSIFLNQSHKHFVFETRSQCTFPLSQHLQKILINFTVFIDFLPCAKRKSKKFGFSLGLPSVTRVKLIIPKPEYVLSSASLCSPYFKIPFNTSSSIRNLLYFSSCRV